MENQKSAIGLDGNLAAAIGYPIGIIALILIFIEKENKFVRFHAIQSILWGLLYAIVFSIVFVIGFVLVFGGALAGVAGNAAGSGAGSIFGGLLSLVGWLLFLASFVVGLGGFIAMVYAAVKSYGGAKVKLPVVGNFAEKWSA